MPAARPLPAPSSESRAFWAGAEHGQLVLRRCANCGRMTGPAASHCPDCLSGDLQPTTCSGRATLKGRTVLHVPAYEGQQVPCILVQCAVAEEPRVILVAIDQGNVTGDLRPDAPIHIAFTDPDGRGHLATVELPGDP